MDSVAPPAAAAASAGAGDAKATLRALIAQKDGMEAELEALHSQAAAGQQLLDAEGFPRSDLDVHAVRNARNELARKQNDHKALMARIEQAMFAMHAEAKANKAQQRPEAIQSVQQVRRAPGEAPAARVPPPSAADAVSSDAVPAAGADVIPTDGAASASASASSLAPFYIVNSVAPDSPASVAGLRAGDLVLQFGSVTAANNRRSPWQQWSAHRSAEHCM